MALEDYQRKRNFSRTPEPSGSEDFTFQFRYVIQRHDARRLHYDFRLEMEGVLKSWAVPKGPSMNPDDKRLAVHTEDHPIKYLHFQGTIPKGNYGAGEMTIWDQGTYASYKNPDDPKKLKKEYENGTLHLIFYGQKLQGKFTLVRTNYGKKDQWLLIKKDDEYSIDEEYDAEGQFVKYCDHITEEGRFLYQEAVDRGLEGIIAKRKASLYYPGKRSEEWLKIKQIQTADTIICGYTETEKSGRPFGSLILGIEKNGQLQFSGNCGTGFLHYKLDELYKRFQSLKQNDNPFSERINLKGRTPVWLSPELVCEMKYSEATEDGRFRHPVFLRMRPDKNRNGSMKTGAYSTFTSDLNQGKLEINGINLALSNLEKIYWPESGLRKYDLLEYYIAVSDMILPYLTDRPQSLHRHPNGIDQPGFYQKDQENLPDWIATTVIHSESADKDINYLLCQNEATLLYMVNLGCIEINPWLSRENQIDYPDYAVIDLDPSPTNTFDQVIETALIAKEVLDQIGIQGYPKTSGSRGIHIYIPLGGVFTFDQARDFTRLLCIMIRKSLPDLTTLERSLKKRNSKIYLDYLQNRRGQTIVAPYSVRPIPGAWVSTPMTWEELELGIELKDYNIHTVPSRLKEKSDLFFGIFHTEINMMEVIEKMENIL